MQIHNDRWHLVFLLGILFVFWADWLWLLEWFLFPTKAFTVEHCTRCLNNINDSNTNYYNDASYMEVLIYSCYLHVVGWQIIGMLLVWSRVYFGLVFLYCGSLCSCRCVIGEIFSRKPVFLGSDEQHQIEVISKVCGTPNTSNWPDVAVLPLHYILKNVEDYPRLFHDAFH